MMFPVCFDVQHYLARVPVDRETGSSGGVIAGGTGEPADPRRGFGGNSGSCRPRLTSPRRHRIRRTTLPSVFCGFCELCGVRFVCQAAGDRERGAAAAAGRRSLINGAVLRAPENVTWAVTSGNFMSWAAVANGVSS